MDNIEAFDITAATIFARLYKKFPEKDMITYELFCSELDIKDYTDEQKMKMCKATMTFLQENGFIISNSKSESNAWAYVSLTMKGLEALKSKPKTLSKEESIGKRLLRAVESGSTDIAVHLAQDALSALFKL